MHEGHHRHIGVGDFLAHQHHLGKAAGNAAHQAGGQADAGAAVRHVAEQQAHAQDDRGDQQHHRQLGDDLAGGVGGKGPADHVTEYDEGGVAQADRPANRFFQGLRPEDHGGQRPQHPGERDRKKEKQNAASGGQRKSLDDNRSVHARNESPFIKSAVFIYTANPEFLQCRPTRELCRERWPAEPTQNCR